MALINKQDTNGSKGVLDKGELGYDDYASGGDAGRVYVGNGSSNIALAKKSELEANTWRGISDSVSSTDTGISASSKAVKTAYDKANHGHPYNTVIGTDTDLNTSGSTIIDNIYVTDGVVTSMGTRTLTAADLGAVKLGSTLYKYLISYTDNSTGGRSYYEDKMLVGTSREPYATYYRSYGSVTYYKEYEFYRSII